jgi:hypothetical protein
MFDDRLQLSSVRPPVPEFGFRYQIVNSVPDPDSKGGYAAAALPLNSAK